MESVLERLKHIIAERLDANLKLEEVKADIPISEDGLGLDSIMIVEFIVLIEETFGFQFNEDELTSGVFTNLNTLAAFIANRQTARVMEGSWKDRLESARPISEAGDGLEYQPGLSRV
ncbi:MAG: phosphopantetheine-binding protein [Methylococcaceae bacterium]|nr:phosphopantetheine-binding protein [Methylococcaceae bacterium]